MSLVDAVECVIGCAKCDNKIGGFGIGDYDLAENAFRSGWHETRNGNVICPKCDKRKKKS
jgi:hypothetical protein